jgi:hypothetical protein
VASRLVAHPAFAEHGHVKASFAPVRFLVAGVLVMLGLLAELALAGQVPTCLGPLGVTPVQCARATGILPHAGIGLPILVLCLAAATSLSLPPPVGRRQHALIGALLGGLAAGCAYLIFRPRAMEGFDSSGAWLSLSLPLDPNAFVASVITGVALGSELLSWLPIRRGRPPSESPGPTRPSRHRP